MTALECGSGRRKTDVVTGESGAMRRLLMIAILALAPAGVFAQSPSFDCARAKEPVETAICRSAALATLDRDIAAAYGAAARRLDPAGRSALKESQQGFLEARELAMDWPPEAERLATLEDLMKERLALLRRVKAAPAGEGAAAFLGSWEADYGTVKVTAARGGRLAVEISTAAPVTGRWVCEGSGEARLAGGSLAFNDDGVTVTLSRKGSALVVEERTASGSVRGTCGANGTLRGEFFKVD